MTEASFENPAEPPQVIFSSDGESLERPAQAEFQPLGLVGLIGLVIASDYCLYQGAAGMSGWAAFLVIALACLIVGIGLSGYRRLAVVLTGLVLVTSFRLLWQGNFLLVAAGLVQLSALAIVLHGHSPWMGNLFLFLLGLIPKGLVQFPAALLTSTGVARLFTGERMLNYGLPAVVCGVFITMFVYANPAAIQWCTAEIERWADQMLSWIVSVPIGQLLLWGLVSILGLGAITPYWRVWQPPSTSLETPRTAVAVASRWVVPCRNLLWGVIATFSIYLVVEFATLWFRDFPEGFYYSGYAHQGAAWLTLALLCTTLVLSAIFRGELLDDPRVIHLRKLASVWSLLNYLLAISVYHRMLIYVDFNGMTFLRVIGFYGITCVVLGFSLVLWKIHTSRSFAWLIQRQLVVFSFSVYLLALTPIDWITYRINSARVLTGDLAPVVQVTEQRLSPEAWLSIWPLVDSPQTEIRNGVRAHLAQQLVDADKLEPSPPWQQHQASQTLLYRQLVTHRELLSPFLRDPTARQAAIAQFKQFAYQWY